MARREPHGVLVVDDSELMRSMLGDYIEASGPYRVVGGAATGYEAIRQVHALDPAIVTLDLQMPDLGGLDVLRYIMAEAPRPVVIVSAHPETLQEPGVQALMSGAVEFVAKPESDDAAEVQQFRQRLQHAMRAAVMARLLRLPERQQLAERRRSMGDRDGGSQASMAADTAPARCAVAVAASTGGPRALAELLPRLPAELPAAVLVVQHMPQAFTGPLARRLADLTAMPAREATQGELLRQGVIYVAPGGVHLDLRHGADGVYAELSSEAPVWGVRPAADVLFAAVARCFGPASVGVVMTGMGRDGAEGSRLIRDAGGMVVTQDEASSVIGSMPRAAAAYAEASLPPAELARSVTLGVARQLQARNGG